MNSNLIDKREIRRFGLIALIFFGLLSTLGIFFQKPSPTIIFGTLSAIGLCFFLFPIQLKGAYAAWMKIAHFIGRAVTIIILTVVYYLVITPSALLKRILGGSPLPLKPDANISTYWVKRPEYIQNKDQFHKRF